MIINYFHNKKFFQEALIPLIIFGVGFFWRCFYLSDRDLCLDEPFSLFHAQKQLLDIIQLSSEGEPNPPLFMLLLHFWIKIGGTEVSFVRLLPLVFSSLTAVFLYLAGKRFYSLGTGILASFLFLFSNFHFFHSIELRTYSLLSFAAATALYYFLRLIKEPERKWILVMLISSNLILVYSHYFGWFIVMMQVFSLIFYLKDIKVLKSIFVTLFLTILAYIPFFIVLVRQFLKSSQGTWVEPPGSGSEYFYQIHNLLNHKEVFNVVIWIIILGAIYAIYKKNREAISKDFLILLLWWFVPFTLMFIISYRIPVFITRYLLLNSIALYLFIASSVSVFFNRHRIIEPVLGLIILLMMMNRMRILPDDFSYREVKNATAYVKTNLQYGDIVLLYPYWSDKEFSYYFDRRIFSDTENLTKQLAQEKVFPVWDKRTAETIVNTHNSRRIIYYLNGPSLGDDNGIFRFLSEKFTIIDSTFYPQTISITIFKAK
jgi:uncharacterized membrane protein